MCTTKQLFSLLTNLYKIHTQNARSTTCILMSKTQSNLPSEIDSNNFVLKNAKQEVFVIFYSDVSIFKLHK
jgi:hypothetical protein